MKFWEGFSVVCGVTAILGGGTILFGRLIERSRESNRQESECASRLNQLALATLMYSMDNDDFHPPYLTHPRDQRPLKGGAKQWMFTLQPYVKNDSIFYCPLDKQGPKTGITSYRHTPEYPGKLVKGLWVVHERDFKREDLPILQDRVWEVRGPGMNPKKVSFHSDFYHLVTINANLKTVRLRSAPAR